MLYQKLAGIAGLVLFGLILLYLGITAPIPTGVAAGSPASEAIYATSGSYSVGLQTVQTKDDNPLDLLVWYPASNAGDSPANSRYKIQMKMGNPFGAVTVVTYDGGAVPNATYDLSSSGYPLIILSPGFSMGALSYGWLAEHLASHGFVVVAPEHKEHFDGELNGLWQAPATRPQDIVRVLNYIDAQVAAGGAFENLIDAERVAVMGHSYGGYTTLAAGGARIDPSALRQHCAAARASQHPAAWLCDEIEPHLDDMATLAGLDPVPDGLWQLPTDPRIDAIVPLAGDAYFFGETGLGAITIPVMAIGGTDDKDTPFDWGSQPTYDHVSSPSKVLVGLQGAEHMIFAGPCEAIPLVLRLVSDEFCNDGEWYDRKQAHNLVKHFTTAFLLSELEDNAQAATELAPQNITLTNISYTAQGY